MRNVHLLHRITHYWLSVFLPEPALIFYSLWVSSSFLLFSGGGVRWIRDFFLSTWIDERCSAAAGFRFKPADCRRPEMKNKVSICIFAHITVNAAAVCVKETEEKGNWSLEAPFCRWNNSFYHHFYFKSLNYEIQSQNFFKFLWSALLQTFSKWGPWTPRGPWQVSWGSF